MLATDERATPDPLEQLRPPHSCAKQKPTPVFPTRKEETGKREERREVVGAQAIGIPAWAPKLHLDLLEWTSPETKALAARGQVGTPNQLLHCPSVCCVCLSSLLSRRVAVPWSWIFGCLRRTLALFVHPRVRPHNQHGAIQTWPLCPASLIPLQRLLTGGHLGILFPSPLNLPSSRVIMTAGQSD